MQKPTPTEVLVRRQQNDDGAVEKGVMLTKANKGKSAKAPVKTTALLKNPFMELVKTTSEEVVEVVQVKLKVRKKEILI